MAYVKIKYYCIITIDYKIILTDGKILKNCLAIGGIKGNNKSKVFLKAMF